MAIQKLYFYNFTVSKLLKGDHTVDDIATTNNMYTVQNAASQNLTFTLWSQENFPFGLLKPSIRNTQSFFYIFFWGACPQTPLEGDITFASWYFSAWFPCNFWQQL